MSNWDSPGGHEESQPHPDVQPGWSTPPNNWNDSNPGASGAYPSGYNTQPMPQGAPPQHQPAYGQPPLAPPPQPYGPGGFYFPQQVAKPGVMALRPQSVGDVLEVAFSTIKANPGATFGISILTGLVSLLISVVLVVVLGGSVVSQTDHSGTVGAVVIIALVIAVPLLMLTSFVSLGALVHVFSQAVLGHRTTIGEALRTGFKRMWAVLGLSILLGLMYFAAVLILALFLAGLGAGHVHPAIIVLVALVLIPVMIFLGVRFAFTLHAVVLETSSPARAIGRSVRLTRKRSWRTFGIVLLSLVVVMVVSSVVQMIGGVISSVAVGTTGGTFSQDTNGLSTAALIGSTLITGLLGMIVGAFTQPFFLNVIGALYLDARFRDEGLAATLAAQSDQSNAGASALPPGAAPWPGSYGSYGG